MSVLEDFMVLIYDKESEKFIIDQSRFLNLALSGGILLELILTGRLAIVKNSLTVVDETPLDDSTLNDAFEIIKSNGELKSPLYWIRKLTDQLDNIEVSVKENLVSKDIFKIEKRKWLFFFEREVYLLSDFSRQQALRDQICADVTSDKEIQPKHLALLSLISATNSASVLFDSQELEEYLDKIRGMVSGENIGQSVAQSIQDLTDALLRTYIHSAYIY